jgi:hypothetical protein
MRSPLPLKPFESYMLADDRPSHPMSFMVHLKFSGRFDRAGFVQAVADALERHPLLSARVARHARRGLCWDWQEAPAPYVDIADESKPLAFPNGEQIDLRRGCGVRIWVRLGPGRCEMQIQFHHACTDGIGAFRFVEDLLCAYHNRTSQRQVALRPLNAELLETRTRFGMNWFAILMRLPIELWALVIGFATFFLRRPAKIYSPPCSRPFDPNAVAKPPVHTHTEHDLAVLRQRARRQKATINDLLTRDVCQALQNWNERFFAGSRFKPIRVTVPVNLRSDADEAMPAANVVGMVFVDRQPAWYASSRWLLKTISWELGIVKRFRLALAFVRGTTLVNFIPGGLRFLTRANRCYATCVFSNIGQVLDKTPLSDNSGKVRAGALVLDAAVYTTPVRPHTSVGLSCTTYAGRMRLVLNYDRHALAADWAEALLQTIVERVGIESAPAALPASPSGRIRNSRAA